MIATCHLIRSLLASKHRLLAEELVSDIGDKLRTIVHFKYPQLKGMDLVYVAEFVAKKDNEQFINKCLDQGSVDEYWMLTEELQIVTTI